MYFYVEHDGLNLRVGEGAGVAGHGVFFARSAQQRDKFLHAETGAANEAAQGSFRHFAVIGNGERGDAAGFHEDVAAARFPSLRRRTRAPHRAR